jgi:transposase
LGTGRRLGGQPGHPGRFRSLLPVKQVDEDEVVVVVPQHCDRCQQPFPSTDNGRPWRPWRRQVVELLPLAVRVTEYQMDVRRCAHCGKRTRAALPQGYRGGLSACGSWRCSRC